MIERIKEWIVSNHMDTKWHGPKVFEIDGKRYFCLEPKDGKIVDEEFKIIKTSDESEESLLCDVPNDFYCFAFGGRVYYNPCLSDATSLNLLKYIGKAKDIEGYSYLGVHGGYEVCSGSRKYEDWCKKAKFLGIQALGLTEKHTLAGALKFQSACSKAKIKPIIGETVTVRFEQDDYKVKLYVKDQIGWQNLLKIHKRLNVDNLSNNIEEAFLVDHLEGLFLVFNHDVMLTTRMSETYQGKSCYFQFDPVQYKTEQRDVQCLNCLKHYLHNFAEMMPLALITDSYYLDPEDASVKQVLSFIGKGEFSYQSTDQHFKSLNDVANQSSEMFATVGDDFAVQVIQMALDGLDEIVNGCTFTIKTGEIHLPKYQLSEEEKEAGYVNNQDLFWDIISAGLKKKVEDKGKDYDKYVDRITTESEVILESGLEDYFLILHDLVSWCKKNNILTGIGRGSAAGSLISYCMHITEVDPLEYDLLFERFVNRGRLPKVVIENGVRKLVGGSLADVDLDVTSERRDDVKRYIESRYGVHNVCSIGTFNSMKTGQAFRDLLRFHGETPQNINFYMAMLDDSGNDYATIFKEASENTKLKEFIDNHLPAVQDIPMILGQPKSSSIHASGIVITPTDGGMQIYDWFPCKIVDGLLISEWEGGQLDETGFLKVDVLGLKQLDKFQDILNLIEKNYSEKIDLNELPLDATETYKLFGNGMNQDVFQFSSDGLSAYCREMKPANVEDLTLINAIYRPGPMRSGAHTDIVKIKSKKKELKYDFGTEEITSMTYGFAIFQEQVMQICVKLGGFTLVEADDIRKAMGKKLEEKIKPYRDKFITGAIKNGCPVHDAALIWNKLELFAGYGFNKSHSVSYAITGYRCQWLKHHYPLEFWTTSLQFAKKEEPLKFMGEIKKFDGIQLLPPDINKSRETFYTDWQNKAIYWSLSKIDHVGEVALVAIMEEREKNGNFFSLAEFVKRLKGKSVNSRVVKHLIITGCFDEMYSIEHPIERKKILDEYSQLYKIKELDEFSADTIYSEFHWFKLQRKLSGGYGFFDYCNGLVDGFMFARRQYVEPDQVQMSDNLEIEVVVAGIIVDYVKRKTKKGEMCKITIDNNSDLLDLVLWNYTWEQYRQDIDNDNSPGRGIVMYGMIQYDNYNKRNAVYSIDKTTLQLY